MFGHKNVSDAKANCSDNATTVNDLREVEEFDQVEVKCSVAYTGNWSPTLQCLPATELDTSHETTSDTVLYRHTINMTRNLQNTSFYCHVNNTQWYSSSLGLTAQATADSYHHQWRSQAITVKCKSSY